MKTPLSALSFERGFEHVDLIGVLPCGDLVSLWVVVITHHEGAACQYGTETDIRDDLEESLYDQPAGIAFVGAGRGEEVGRGDGDEDVNAIPDLLLLLPAPVIHEEVEGGALDDDIDQDDVANDLVSLHQVEHGVDE